MAKRSRRKSSAIWDMNERPYVKNPHEDIALDDEGVMFTSAEMPIFTDQNSALEEKVGVDSPIDAEQDVKLGNDIQGEALGSDVSKPDPAQDAKRGSDSLHVPRNNLPEHSSSEGYEKGGQMNLDMGAAPNEDNEYRAEKVSEEDAEVENVDSSVSKPEPAQDTQGSDELSHVPSDALQEESSLAGYEEHDQTDFGADLASGKGSEYSTVKDGEQAVQGDGLGSDESRAGPAQEVWGDGDLPHVPPDDLQENSSFSGYEADDQIDLSMDLAPEGSMGYRSVANSEKSSEQDAGDQNAHKVGEEQLSQNIDSDENERIKELINALISETLKSRGVSPEVISDIKERVDRLHNEELPRFAAELKELISRNQGSFGLQGGVASHVGGESVAGGGAALVNGIASLLGGSASLVGRVGDSIGTSLYNLSRFGSAPEGSGRGMESLRAGGGAFMQGTASLVGGTASLIGSAGKAAFGWASHAVDHWKNQAASSTPTAQTQPVAPGATQNAPAHAGGQGASTGTRPVTPAGANAGAGGQVQPPGTATFSGVQAPPGVPVGVASPVPGVSTLLHDMSKVRERYERLAKENAPSEKEIRNKIGTRATDLGLTESQVIQEMKAGGKAEDLLGEYSEMVNGDQDLRLRRQMMQDSLRLWVNGKADAIEQLENESVSEAADLDQFNEEQREFSAVTSKSMPVRDDAYCDSYVVDAPGPDAQAIMNGSGYMGQYPDAYEAIRDMTFAEMDYQNVLETVKGAKPVHDKDLLIKDGDGALNRWMVNYERGVEAVKKARSELGNSEELEGMDKFLDKSSDKMKKLVSEMPQADNEKSHAESLRQFLEQIKRLIESLKRLFRKGSDKENDQSVEPAI